MVNQQEIRARKVHRRSADKRALERSKNGLSRELEQVRTDHAVNPGLGGSKGYPLYFRNQVVNFAFDHGIHATLVKYSSLSQATIYRWLNRITPYRQTGNKERAHVTGFDQFLLSIALFTYPTGTAETFAMFIIANGGRTYSNRAITRKLKEMKVSNKKASIEAYEAYSERNIIRSRLYWNSPPRIGVRGIPRWRLLDIDEAGFTLKDCPRRYGWGFTSVRVRTTGHYTRNLTKVNLILAVEPGNPNLPEDVRGSTAKPRKWFKLSYRNVDQSVFAEFIDEMCAEIEENPVPGDEERYFLWDNLSVHQTPLVMSTLEDRPTRAQHKFTAIPRPPYQPKWAPIEYVFCQVSTKLSKAVKQSWTIQDLHDELHNIVVAMGYMDGGSMNKTFSHCGYNF
jgi:hypothetical protein